MRVLTSMMMIALQLKQIQSGVENQILSVNPFTLLRLICGVIVNILLLMLIFLILIVRMKIGLTNLAHFQVCGLNLKESFCSSYCNLDNAKLNLYSLLFSFSVGLIAFVCFLITCSSSTYKPQNVIPPFALQLSVECILVQL